MLLANVTILERSHHSIPAKYVKFGQDAAVSYGYMDLKFRNDLITRYTLIQGWQGSDLFYIYGDRNSKDYMVRIDSETIETIVPKEETIVDNSLEPGGQRK